MPDDRTLSLPPDDELDAGLAAAYGAASSPGVPLAGQSVLTTMGMVLASLPRIQLRQGDGEAETPVQRPGSSEMPVLPAHSDRYQLHGEIARGGMGAIIKGHDVDLGRDIAIKVLLETHKGRGELLNRFIEEAQIGGQLQHPNIVPVYEMGQFPGQRPYFTMKLIKGQTLAKHLAQRDDPRDERPRFLKDFEKVCQAIAFAHSKGVIHRDLKPANIMIGSYGEVQVMDWGLAKVLAEGSAPDKKRARTQPDASVIRTVRSEGSDDGEIGTQTMAGTVLGTPAYMSPEQAMGDADEVDERTDVFGLGAILCEILTGKPPYVTEDDSNLFRKARRADLTDAFARLDACEADSELIDLTKRCLHPEAKHRPRDAGVLAAELNAYLESVDARLRQSEVDRARTEAKSVEERKRRRVVRALLAALLVICLGGSGFWLAQRRASELRELKLNRDVADTLGRADVLREQGKNRPVDPQRLTSLREQARQAQSLLESGPIEAALSARVAELQAHLETQEQEHRFWTDIDQARLVQTSFDPERKQLNYADGVRLYREAFARFGLSVGSGEPSAAATQIRERSVMTRDALVAALDEWITLAGRAENKIDEPHLDWLREVVKAADPDPWRQQVRAAAEEKDATRRREQMVRLAGSADVSKQPVQAVLNLARSLDEKTNDARLRLLQRTVAQYPEDFWVHTTLGETLLPRVISRDSNRRDAEQALRHFTAALALRPKDPFVHSNTGYALITLQQYEDAERAFRRSIALEPRSYRAYNGLGITLRWQNKPTEARKVYESALPLVPNDSALSSLWNNLGTTYLVEELDQREAAFRKSIKLDGRNATARVNLANVLVDRRMVDAALKELRDAAPHTSEAKSQTDFGYIYLRLRRYGEAITSFRRVTQITPTDAQAFASLGLAYLKSNQAEQAVTALQYSIKLRPDDVETLERLSEALRLQGQTDEAARLLRKAHALRTGSDLPLALTVIDYLEIHEVDAETLQSWIDTLPTPEYRPASVSVRPGSSPPRFTAIAIRDGRRIPWSMDWTRNMDETGAINNQRINAGYRKLAAINLLDRAPAEPMHVEIYWKDGLPWDYSLGKLPSDTWNTPNSPDEANARRNAVRPIFCYNPQGKRPARHFSAYVAPDEGLDWAAHFDLSLDELLAQMKEIRKKGWRPDAIQVWPSESGPAFQLVAVSNPGNAAWEFRHDLTQAELEETMAEQKRLGRRPIAVVSYGDDKAVRFAAVWLEYKPSPDVVPVVSDEQLKSAKYHHARGLLALHHKKPDEAIAAFRKALELDAAFEPAAINLARLLAQEHPDEAKGVYEKLLKANPGSADGHLGLAEIQSRRGERDASELGRRKAKVLKEGIRNPFSVVDYKAVYGVNAKELQAWVDELPRPWYRPVVIHDHVGANPPRFNAIAIRDTQPLAFSFSLSPPDFRSLNQQGYSHLVNRQYGKDVQNTVQVFVQDRVPRYAHHGVRDAVVNACGNVKQTGQRLSEISMNYGMAGEFGYNSISGPDDGLDWEMHTDLSAEDLKRTLTQARRRGWRPDLLTGRIENGEMRYWVLLVSNHAQATWDFHADSKQAEFDQLRKDQHALGRRPLAVLSRGDKDATRYAAIWIDYLAALEKRADPPPVPALKPGEKRDLYIGTKVSALAVHPDGEKLLVGSRTPPHHVTRDIATGRHIDFFWGYNLTCLAAAWSHDGKLAAAGTGPPSGSLNIWTPTTRINLSSLATNLGDVNSVEFSRDGKSLVSAHANSIVRLSAVVGLKPIHSFEFPKDVSATRATFSPDGKRLLMTTSTKAIRVADVASGKDVLTFDAPLAGQVGAWLSDSRIVTGGADGFVRLWDDKSGKELATWDAGSAITHIAMSPDGKRLLTTHTQQKAVQVWDIATQKQLAEYKEEGELHRAVFSPDGKLAVVGSEAGYIHVYALPK